MKKSIHILLLVLFAIPVYTQEIKKDDKSKETKFDVFSSKTGIITKFIDTKLPSLKLSYGMVAETRIRKIITGPTSGYFLQVEKEGKYNNSVASIDYTDLLEILKALANLKSDVEKDIAGNPDYLENKFITSDGFQLGYYVSKGKASWYVKLEKYGSDNTIFVNDPAGIEEIFNLAKQKIEDAKNKKLREIP